MLVVGVAVVCCIVGIAAMQRWLTARDRARFSDRPALPADSHLVRFAGITLDEEAGTVHLDWSGEGGSIAGARARVETSGSYHERVTVARLLTAGVFAFGWKKPDDRRELHLTVEGAGFGFVVTIDPNQELYARRFATRVNAAASLHTGSEEIVDDADVDVVEQISALYRLVQAGALSLDEFSAAKAELLRRL